MCKDIVSSTIKTEISVFYDLCIPGFEGPLPLVIALHGYGENKEKMMKLLKTNLTEPCYIASLQAPFPHIVPPVLPGRPIKHGFGWITSFNPGEAIRLHHQAVGQVIDDVLNKNKMNISKIILMGFSQSVALNFRYVFSNPNKINNLVAVCGGLPGDWDKNEKYKPSNTDILYVGCKKDMIYPAKKIRENAEKLKTKSRSVEIQIYNAGHQIPLECFTSLNKMLSQ
ncbi:MAG: hypothetical protein D8M58_10980 [Calditrichaeota bacterium]|nr:MAG: hypothetical protein DWQ03_10355 [Calditrichota bacterium]MBL1205916.1 hypothetical protein [Calditrichota bacterium]NOG45744.1 hypothetical protein [Calditrichota bacterium]